MIIGQVSENSYEVLIAVISTVVERENADDITIGNKLFKKIKHLHENNSFFSEQYVQAIKYLCEMIKIEREEQEIENPDHTNFPTLGSSPGSSSFSGERTDISNASLVTNHEQCTNSECNLCEFD